MDLGPNVFHLQCIRKHMQILAEMQGHGLEPNYLQCIRKQMQILYKLTHGPCNGCHHI